MLTIIDPERMVLHTFIIINLEWMVLSTHTRLPSSTLNSWCYTHYVYHHQPWTDGVTHVYHHQPWMDGVKHTHTFTFINPEQLVLHTYINRLRRCKHNQLDLLVIDKRNCLLHPVVFHKCNCKLDQMVLNIHTAINFISVTHTWSSIGLDSVRHTWFSTGSGSVITTWSSTGSDAVIHT